jgi:hemoglobin/transferrin/lactoferrin receptor protein
MKIYSLILAMMLFTLSVHSQTISVIDKVNKQTLAGVVVYSIHPKLSLQTNAKGQFDLSKFRTTSSTIYFKAMGYELSSYSLVQIDSMKFSIELNPSSIGLAELIVKPDSWVNQKITTPNRIISIKMKDVAFQNPQTAADLLGASGYAFIQKSQMGGGSPMLRGYATNRVLYVIDDVRMNTAIFRAGNLQNVISLDANAMESTEIIFGPGSVKYGSDAIGGIMRFGTLEPSLAKNNEKISINGNALMRTSSANSEMTAHGDFNIGLKKWAFLTSFTRAIYGDLRAGSKGGANYFYRPSYVTTIDNKDYMVANPDSTLQIGSKYNQTNFMQKIRFKPNAYWNLEYAFHYSQTSSFNRYDRLYVIQTQGPYKNKLRWAEWYYGPQKWDMQRVGINYTKQNIIFDSIRLVAAIQHFEESRYEREFMFRELHMQRERVKASSMNLDAEKNISSKTQLLYGAEWVHNIVNSIASLTHVITKEELPTVTRYPNGSTWQSLGIYANVKHSLTKKLVLNGGIRYNNYRINATFDTTMFPFPMTHTTMKNGAFSGSIGAVYSPMDSWQIYTCIAKGFRSPNIDDMGKVFESTPGYLVVPNPDLKPEKVYNFELGMAKSFGQNLKLDFSAYKTYLFDALVRQDFTFNGQTSIRYLGNASKIQAIQNASEVRVYGIQIGLDFRYKGLGINSAFSYQNGKEKNLDSMQYFPLRHAAPTFGSTHFTYARKKYKLDFYVVYNAKMDPDDLALTERINLSYAKNEQGQNYVAAWHTLNLKGAYFINQNVVIALGIENITDKLYRPYSSGISAPGRNFIASIRTKF